MTKHFNPNEIVTMTQIMAVNREVPRFGGWRWSDDYAGSERRPNGVLGEVSRQGDTVYVCVQECLALRLPNNHPDCMICRLPSDQSDFRQQGGTVWVSVPKPENIDWRYVPAKYRSRDGWRVTAGE